MSGRDILRFVGGIGALIATHSILFGSPDEADVTQFIIMAGVFTVIAAIREAKP